MELALPRNGDHSEFAKVTKRLKDANELPIGTANQNPILDTRMYEVEYQDGHKASMTENSIVKILFAQVNEEGNRHVPFNYIVNHNMDGKDMKQQDAFVTTKSGSQLRQETTQGWEILVQWKDGSTTYVALKDTKEEYLVQTSKYAVQLRFSQEPAFA